MRKRNLCSFFLLAFAAVAQNVVDTGESDRIAISAKKLAVEPGPGGRVEVEVRTHKHTRRVRVIGGADQLLVPEMGCTDCTVRFNLPPSSEAALEIADLGPGDGTAWQRVTVTAAQPLLPEPRTIALAAAILLSLGGIFLGSLIWRIQRDQSREFRDRLNAIERDRIAEQGTQELLRQEISGLRDRIAHLTGKDNVFLSELGALQTKVEDMSKTRAQAAVAGGQSTFTFSTKPAPSATAPPAPAPLVTTPSVTVPRAAPPVTSPAVRKTLDLAAALRALAQINEKLSEKALAHAAETDRLARAAIIDGADHKLAERWPSLATETADVAIRLADGQLDPERRNPTVKAALAKVIELAGVVLIEPRPGDPFSTHEHDPKRREPDPGAGEKNTVGKVIVRGFSYEGRVIRKADVSLYL